MRARFKTVGVVLCLSVGAFALTGCKSLDKLKGMPDQMSEMLEGTRLIKLKIAKDELISQQLPDVSFKSLVPPVDMIPGGKLFGEFAKPEEIIQFCYALLRDVDNSDVDPLTVDTSDPKAKEAAKRAVERSKFVRILALQVIAGWLPQAKLDLIAYNYLQSRTVNDVNSPISTDGGYSATARAILAARAMYILQIEIWPNLGSDEARIPGDTMDPERFERVMAYLMLLDQLAASPVASEVRWEVSRMKYPDNNFKFVLERSFVLDAWKRLLASTGVQMVGYQFAGANGRVGGEAILDRIDPNLRQGYSQKLERRVIPYIQSRIDFWNQTAAVR